VLLTANVWTAFANVKVMVAIQFHAQWMLARCHAVSFRLKRIIIQIAVNPGKNLGTQMTLLGKDVPATLFVLHNVSIIT
jgi:hypothetical protein